MSSALRVVLRLVAAVVLAIVGMVGLDTDVSTKPNPRSTSFSCGTPVSRIDYGTGGRGMACDYEITNRRGWACGALLLSVLGGVVALVGAFRPTDTIGDATPPAA